jgi:nucleoside-diphosphate-sugar epimerase
LPSTVQTIHGDRADLPSFRQTFRDLGPDVVIDLIAFTEQDAKGLVAAMRGVVGHVVLISSQDVYRAYDRVTKHDPGPPDPVSLTEAAPLRDTRYPYAADEADWLYQYDKILVEERLAAVADWHLTTLRLPVVYGPGDYQHRFYPLIRRMIDGRPALLIDEALASWRWTRGYVENVAAAIVCAVEAEQAADRVYNVGAAQTWTEAAWVGRLAEVLGWTGRLVQVRREDLPDALRRDWDPRQHLLVDDSALRRDLGFEEVVGPEEALRLTVAWERAHPPTPAPVFDYAAEDAVLDRYR